MSTTIKVKNATLKRVVEIVNPPFKSSWDAVINLLADKAEAHEDEG